MSGPAPRALVVIDDALMDAVRDQARASERLRAIHRFHEHAEPVQRMLNAVEPGSYVRPHKHEDPDKVEVFLVVRGRVAVLTFDEAGALVEGVVIAARGGVRGVEIPPCTYHTVVSLEAGSVVYEIGQGPYVAATHKRWAPWAPEEGSPAGTRYLADLRASLGL